jgi:glutamate-1-semialdehyde 2,1-aminomutase
MAHNVAGLPARSSMQTELASLSKSIIPGGTFNSIVPPDGLEFLIDRGEGTYVFDTDGRRFLDFMMGAGATILGHAHPRIVATVAAAAESGTHHCGLCRRAVELAQRLVEHVPSAGMVRFTGSGSESTFHALRLARAATGRQSYIKFDGAYHGHHDLASWSFEHGAASSVPRQESAGIQHGVEQDVVVLNFNDATGVRHALRSAPERFAAVIVEPMQRMLPPVPGFLETLRLECNRAGVVLIFDEVVTGFRLSRGGAQERYGVIPDLTCLGKAMAGGVPLAALVGRRALMECFAVSSQVVRDFDLNYRRHTSADVAGALRCWSTRSKTSSSAS